MQCRSMTLSCHDCGKDFPGQTWKAHNSCVSEDQKYGGVNYQAKEGANKNLKKQETWIENFRNACTTAPGHISHYLEKLVEFPNLPRKKPKFTNFLKSALHVHDERTVNELWSVVESANKVLADNATSSKPPAVKRPAPEEAEKKVENGSKKAKTKSTESKDKEAEKRPAPEDENKVENGSKKSKTKSKDEKAVEPSVVAGDDVKAKKFKWVKAIKAILKDQEGKEMKLKKLKKQLRSQYSEETSDSLGKTELNEKIDSIMATSSKFEINEKLVKLLSI